MSFYNVRLYDYKYSQQIRIYSKTINRKKETAAPESRRTATDSPEPERTEQQIERSLKVSANRTKQAIYNITRSNAWDWFITFTFDRLKVDASDYDGLVKIVRKWFNNMKSRRCPGMKYIIIPELHADGVSYHFHGLLADCGNLSFRDSGVIQGGRKVYNILDFPFGFTTATKVGDTRRVSSYVSKYITKDLEKHLKGKRRYLASNNCCRASVMEYAMSEEEIMGMLDMVSEEIVYAKTEDIPVAYQKVKYIELRKE